MLAPLDPVQRLKTQVRCGEPIPVGPEPKCCEQRICVRQWAAAGVGAHRGTRREGLTESELCGISHHGKNEAVQFPTMT